MSVNIGNSQLPLKNEFFRFENYRDYERTRKIKFLARKYLLEVASQQRIKQKTAVWPTFFCKGNRVVHMDLQAQLVLGRTVFGVWPFF